MADEAVEVETTAGGVAIRLRVKPGGRRNRVIGAHGGALKIEVTAVPEAGRANRAVIDVLVRAFGVSRSSVRISSGRASQDKRVTVDGLSVQAAIRMLAAAGIPAAASGARGLPA